MVVYLKSLISAIKEQRLSPLFLQLEEIVPNISDQYSCFKLDSEYLITKVRGVHSFQMMLTKEAISLIDKTPITVVDIGDSSGTHIQYIKNNHNNTRCLSVNLDETAVNKIKSKGLEAIFSRAEELFEHSINADIFLSFEMLEHLTDPIKFLHQLSEKTSCKYFVATMPYVRNSRVALNHIRQNIKKSKSAENTHIFEFSPHDWKLIFRHSGWDIVFDKIYFQYPKKNILWFTKYIWRKNDFEGFYGVILKRDNTWSSLYKDW